MATYRSLVVPISQGIKLFVEYYAKYLTKMEYITKEPCAISNNILMYGLYNTRHCQAI